MPTKGTEEHERTFYRKSASLPGSVLLWDIVSQDKRGQSRWVFLGLTSAVTDAIE